MLDTRNEKREEREDADTDGWIRTKLYAYCRGEGCTREEFLRTLEVCYILSKKDKREELYLLLVALMKDGRNPQGLFSEAEVRGMFSRLKPDVSAVQKDKIIISAKLPQGHVFHADAQLRAYDQLGGGLPATALYTTDEGEWTLTPPRLRSLL